jgi:uncharacterized protein YtpQ (UPF0354 family)
VEKHIMFGWFKKKNPVAAEPDRSTLVARIKTLQFTAALKGMNIPEDQLPYTEPLVADLLVTYAFDLPGMFQMASGAAIAELGIRPEEVRAVAVANLKRQLPQIGSAEHGPARRIVTGENMEACTILAGPYWDQIAAETEGEVVVAVPSRDVVLFCSSKSAEGIAALRAASAEVLQEETTHRLTERLLVWRGGRWAEFR